MGPEKMVRSLLCLLLLLLTLATNGSFGANPTSDWMQYRGPERTGISPETGLLKTWPAAGPRSIWKIPIGEGYSGMAISNGRLYTMDAKNGEEHVVAIDAPTGKEVWRFRTDAVFVNDQGNGPRGTPTVDGNVLYVLGAQSTLYALESASGKKIWGHDLKQSVRAKVPIWGASASPLVEGDRLIVPAGGADGNAILCFNKKNGELIWKSQTDEPGYSSPIAITMHGVRQIVVFTGTALQSVSPQDGKLLWRYPWRTDWFVNAAIPIFVPDDKIFISTSYDRGAAMLRIRSEGGRMSVEEAWLSKGMKNHFNSSVLHQGHIYGFDNAVLKCIDAKTGEDKWKKSGFGKGSLIMADGHLYVLSERGQLLLVEATPEKYIEKASFQALQGKCWTEPTISGKKLYLRNQKEMMCLDLGAKT